MQANLFYSISPHSLETKTEQNKQQQKYYVATRVESALCTKKYHNEAEDGGNATVEAEI